MTMNVLDQTIVNIGLADHPTEPLLQPGRPSVGGRRLPDHLRRHKRFHLHFIPTASSWLNLVERWFRDITTKRIRRGSFGSVPQLIFAIEDYIAHNNQDLRPFVWTKTAGQIIAKVRRGRVALEAVKQPSVI
jgi:hypothetical protein